MQPAQSSDENQTAAGTRDLTAIVVDDSRTSRNYMKLMLGQAGVRVVAEAASGDQALALYLTHKPTLVTLDIVLPGLDGISAARQILEADRAATVVMCSSLTAREKILECRAAGVAHFIVKPSTPEKFVSVIANVLARPSVAGASR